MQEIHIGGSGPPAGESRDPRERWWYQRDEYQLASRLLATADAIDTRTRSRQLGILDRLVRLYGDFASVPDGVPLIRRGKPEERRPVAANICDTLAAQISKTPPRPMFVTHGGSWDQQRTAERLTAGCDWKFSREGMISKARRVAIDSMMGAGFIRPVAQLDGSVSLERCFPCDVLMDDSACVDEMPRDIYHRRFLDRAMLWELYPDKETRRMIEDAEPAGWCLTNPHSASADVVEVIEGWHLPSYQGEIDGRAAKDGRWALVLRTGSDGGGVLNHGEYTRPHHCIVGMRSIKPCKGWWGLPLIDRVAASHLELNKIMNRIGLMMHRNATNRTWLHQNSSVSPADIQNTIGAIIRYSGSPVQKPIFEAPNPVNPGLFDYCERLEDAGHKDAGVSRFASSATAPSNLESGRAIRIHREEGDIRQVDIYDEFELMHCELARRWAEAEAEQAEDDPKRETPYEIDGCRESIRWAHVTKELDSMAITPKPTSGLAATPAARMQDIQDGVKEGTFTPEDALRLSTDPDLKSLREERLAPVNRLRKVLSGMLDGGDYVAPDQEMDLARGVALCLTMINAAVVRGCPPERINLLRRWWPEAQAILDRIAAEQAPPPGPMPVPGAEMGPPGAGVQVPPGLVSQGLGQLPSNGPDELAAAALGAEQTPPLPVPS
jgi:hypothetical protein